MNRPAKICNLQLSIGPQQQVFWFDVPVNHLLRVTVVEGIGQFHDVLVTHNKETCIKFWISAFIITLKKKKKTLNTNINHKKRSYCSTSVFWETSTSLQLTIQFTFGCKFKDEIHTSRVVEVTVETEDVRVPVGDGWTNYDNL